MSSSCARVRTYKNRYLRSRYLIKLMIAQLKERIAEQPITEFKFHKTRKWLFDIYYPSIKMAIEIHGGNWINGGHNRGRGFKNDRQKMNEAHHLGFTVFEFLTEDVENGVAANLAIKYYKNMLIDWNK